MRRDATGRTEISLGWNFGSAMLIDSCCRRVKATPAIVYTFHVTFRFTAGTSVGSLPKSDILPIVGTLALLHSPYSTLFGHTVLLFDLGGTIAAVRMFAMAIVVTVRHTAELYRQEPLP